MNVQLPSFGLSSKELSSVPRKWDYTLPQDEICETTALKRDQSEGQQNIQITKDIEVIKSHCCNIGK